MRVFRLPSTRLHSQTGAASRIMFAMKIHSLFFGAIAILAPSLAVQQAAAHPISMTSVIVDVQPDKVVTELRVMLEDLALFYPIKADGDLIYAADPLRKAAAEHRDFVLKYFHLRDGDGNRLEGKVTGLDVSKIPDEGVPQPELKSRSLIFTLEHAVRGKLGFITVMQNFGGDRSVLPAIMDCIVLQNGTLLDTSEQLLAKTPKTVRFDWENPPERPKNWRELLARREKQTEQRLGIASYTGLYSFIYITRHEVRHEILVPLLTLETWFPIERKNPDFLEVAEQQAAAKAVAQFFRNRNEVKIDGVPVKPTLSRLNFFGLDINDFARNSTPRRVGVYQARLGVILSYSTKGTPSAVEMKWETFNDHVSFLRSAVYEFDKDPDEFHFVPDRPTFTWKAPSKAGAAPPPKPVARVGNRRKIGEREATQVSNALLKNIYRAFDYRDDAEIYDALAHSADGELLRRLFLQIKQSLLMAEQGGALASVQEVRPIDGSLVSADNEGFRFRNRWRVVGTVEHWGHVHTRENEYEALFSFASDGKHWKIVDYGFRRQQRISFETGLRQ